MVSEVKKILPNKRPRRLFALKNKSQKTIFRVSAPERFSTFLLFLSCYGWHFYALLFMHCLVYCSLDELGTGCTSKFGYRGCTQDQFTFAAKNEGCTYTRLGLLGLCTRHYRYYVPHIYYWTTFNGVRLFFKRFISCHPFLVSKVFP